MKAYHILQQIDPEFGIQILHEVRKEDEGMFKTALASLAHQKKLRPVFLQRKSRDDQAAWILKTASIKPYDDIAEHLLQMWLLRSRNGMLVAFLDAMEMEHDGAGATEDMPDEIDPAKLKDAVDTLLADYPGTEVTIYLHMFQMQRDDGWPAISEILENDDRLSIAPPELAVSHE